MLLELLQMFFAALVFVKMSLSPKGSVTDSAAVRSSCFVLVGETAIATCIAGQLPKDERLKSG